MKIVYATNGLPQEKLNGGEIASMNFIDALASAGHDVHVVGYQRIDRPAIEGERIYSAGPWPIEMSDAGMLRYKWVLQSLLTGRPVVNTKFVSGKYLKALRRALAEKADLLVIDHAHMGWLASLSWVPRDRIFVAHNVEADLYRSAGLKASGYLRWLYQRDAVLLSKLERFLIADSVETWCLSDGDRLALAEMSGMSDRIHVFDLPGQSLRDPGSVLNGDKEYDIGLIGSWNWEINRQGVIWFLENVLPVLPRDVSVAIAGAGSETLQCSDSRLTKLGRVPDAARFMQGCRALAVPTTVGSGIQLKTIEGIAQGIPLVATSLAMRGIVDAPEHVRVADSAEGFARELSVARGSDRPDPATGRNWANARKLNFENDISILINNLKLSG
ncbi:glycosyltransferase [Martelella alba]|uniref:Glycosyltransferase n=1 Tax=Martelella alba TaxID=2590451 RepID=A0A506U0T4_9HYPH|nr:glycosyltransferase [Martelella alba]TPW27106.1 glycosyltransferase [Martelella alba]